MKKEKIISGGLLAGAALLMMSHYGLFGDGEDGGAAGTRAGGIVGSRTSAENGGGSIFNIPASAGVTFPKAPSFDLAKIFAPTPDVKEAPSKPIAARGAILGAHERVVKKGFVVSTTFTGTRSTPAFVQRDIYHKQMLGELGLAKKQTVPAGAAPIVSTLQTGFVSRSSGGGSRASSGVSSRRSVSTPKATAKATSRRASLVSRAKKVSTK